MSMIKQVKKMVCVVALIGASHLFCYHESFHAFLQAQQEEKRHAHDMLYKTFSHIDVDNQTLQRHIKADIVRVKKEIVKAQRQKKEVQLLQQKKKDLRSFYRYVRSHKTYHTVMRFHARLAAIYKRAFDNLNIVEELYANPTLFHVQEAKYPAVSFVEKVKADLAQISRFEDLLHADHSILKARNYAYKIELVKIRNLFLHHDAYKEERRYKRKPFKSILFPAAIVGSAGLAVYAVPYAACAGLLSILFAVL